MEKRHSHDRYRGDGLFVERWSNAKAGLVGYYTGLGRSSPQIAAILNDGTSDSTIRTLWGEWGLPLRMSRGKRLASIPIVLSVDVRVKLERRAKRMQIAPEEWLRRIAVAAIEDDLYRAIVGESK